MPVDFFAPFRTLGLDPRANITERDVKQAYRKLALTSHPDKNSNDPNAKSRFQTINTAHENALAGISKLAEEQANSRAQQAKKAAAHRKAQEHAAQEAARHRAQYAAQEAARRAAAEQHEALCRAEKIRKANVASERIRATRRATAEARAREGKAARQAIIARARQLRDEINAQKAATDARMREHESREQRIEEERKRQKRKSDTGIDDVKVGIREMKIDKQKMAEEQRAKMKAAERKVDSEIPFPSAKRQASDGLYQTQPENADTESSKRVHETKARKEYHDTCDPIAFTFNGIYADYDHDTWDAYASTDKRYKPLSDFSSLEDKVFRAIMNSRFEPCFARQSTDKTWLRTVMDDLWITQVLKDIFMRHGKTLYTEEKLQKETYGAFVARARDYGVQFLEAWIQIHRGA